MLCEFAQKYQTHSLYSVQGIKNNILFFKSPSLYTIKGILILDNDGRRILGNYFDCFPNLKEQTAFEKSLFSKTSKANSEVLMLDGLTVLYKSNVDLYFYVLGGPQVQTSNTTLCFNDLLCS